MVSSVNTIKGKIRSFLGGDSMSEIIDFYSDEEYEQALITAEEEEMLNRALEELQASMAATEAAIANFKNELKKESD